ncbi:MAG: hypothetical protein NC180_01075 [Muribaculaceae bacterium]|nr:capsular biosynthesis protein [Roseburia sp.]MCM1431364.1 hypothetical protein [Muribaculaceae bacterium]MCM1491806.1 hypothetical protein [Muribaculaceae bacterium]
MIDIHCHLLYGVDDGARTKEEALQMLRIAGQQEITAIILTPHYRHGMFSHPNETIEAHFLELKPEAEQLGITLALGTEYHVNSQIEEALASRRCRTLAGSRYVLSEYSHDSEYSYIYQMTEELTRHGYIPVLAHVERYACLMQNISLAEELRRLGAWIQLNADAVLGLEGRGPKRDCKRLLAEGYVDVIASDSHGVEKRGCHLQQCRDFLAKKFGGDVAEKLLQANPAMILNDE